MAIISLPIPVRPSLGTILALRLLQGIQAGAASLTAWVVARETQRQLAGLDRRTLADIGIPLNGPRSLATRDPWDTSIQGW